MGHFPEHHEVRCRYPQGPVCKCGLVRRHHDVCRHRRAYDQGVDRLGTLNDEDQGGCTPRKEVFRVDWGEHPLVLVHFPADVDLQGRVRREWSHHRPPQVLLNALDSSMAMLYGWMISSKVHGFVRAQPSE